MDALITDLIARVERDLHRVISETVGELRARVDEHCADPNAHPHEHEISLDAVRAHVDTALTEAAQAVDDEPSEEVPEAVPEPTLTPSPVPPPPTTETPPERVHTLHRRVG